MKQFIANLTTLNTEYEQALNNWFKVQSPAQLTQQLPSYHRITGFPIGFIAQPNSEVLILLPDPRHSQQLMTITQSIIDQKKQPWSPNEALQNELLINIIALYLGIREWYNAQLAAPVPTDQPLPDDAGKLFMTDIRQVIPDDDLTFRINFE